MDNSLRIEYCTSEATGGNTISYFGKLNDGTYFAFTDVTSIGIYNAPYPIDLEDATGWEEKHLIRTDSDIEEETFLTYCEEWCRKANGKDLIDALAVIEMQSAWKSRVSGKINQTIFSELMESTLGAKSFTELDKLDFDTVCEKAKRMVATFLYANF